MGNRITFFFILFALCSVLSGFMAGGDGYAITTLSNPMAIGDVTADVATTGGFLASGSTFWIDNEQIAYVDGSAATEFTGLTRGYGGTTAAAHATNAKVYTEDANTMAYALGFDMAKTITNSGPLAFIVVPMAFLLTTLLRLIEFNWIFMQGDLMWLGIIFFGSAVGLIISIGMSLLSGATSILKP